MRYIVAQSNSVLEFHKGLFLSWVFLLLFACIPVNHQAIPANARAPTPTPDRLAEPVLPENPTQYEQGRHLYWLNCMPCHGDYGQGLTDEFRSLWVEDHQDCWDSGCHGGRADDEGFPIPRTVPAVISLSSDKSPFSTAKDLYDYLHTTHPPQQPGRLADDEYWAITAYVLVENQQLGKSQEIGPHAKISRNKTIMGLAAAVGILLALGGSITWHHIRRRSQSI